MGVLADRKKLVATHPQSLPTRVRVRGDAEIKSTLADSAAGAVADPFASLPSPPAPCPACGLAILWLPTTLDAWRCPTCFPPPIRKMVAARVVLVDVDSEFGISPKWQKLDWTERDGRRSLATTPIACEANGTALVDASAVGGVAAGVAVYGQADSLIQNGGFFIDESLGPPIGADGNRLDDESWWEVGARDVVWNQFFEGRK